MRHRTEYRTAGWPIEPLPPALLRAHGHHRARRAFDRLLGRVARAPRTVADTRGTS